MTKKMHYRHDSRETPAYNRDVITTAASAIYKNWAREVFHDRYYV